MNNLYNPFIGDLSVTTVEELASQGQKGDRDALEQLALRHQPWLLNLVVRLFWFTDEAQDLIQDM